LKPYNNAFVFNGLGSKGVALVPYYSSLMTHHLINGIPLDKEISTERYKNKTIGL
jgi:glycine oxidase